MTTTPCRRDFEDSLGLLNVALKSPYFARRSTRAVEREQQRRDAKTAVAEAMEQITNCMANPAARFALPRRDVRALGRLLTPLGDLLESMGVQGAGSTVRRTAFRSKVVETDMARFRRFGRNHLRRIK